MVLTLQERENHLTLASETNRQSIAHKVISFTNRNVTFKGHQIRCGNRIIVGLGGELRTGGTLLSLFPQIASYLGGGKTMDISRAFRAIH